jgi:hypothetical protein
MTGAQEPETVSTTTQRIAESARNHPQRAFTSLAHHLDAGWCPPLKPTVVLHSSQREVLLGKLARLGQVALEARYPV